MGEGQKDAQDGFTMVQEPTERTLNQGRTAVVVRLIRIAMVVIIYLARDAR